MAHCNSPNSEVVNDSARETMLTHTSHVIIPFCSIEPDVLWTVVWNLLSHFCTFVWS